MRTLARVLRWIDHGYRDGVASSNMALGTTLSLIGLVTLSVDHPAVRWPLFGLAGAIFALFGWRMLLSLRRQADASDRRKGGRR